MNEVPAHLDVPREGDRTHETWETEEDSAREFDERIKRSGLFERSFPEVRGYYLTHRPGREQKDARIDRILIPGAKLKDLGWTSIVGVEFKRSATSFGPAVAQAIDYTYCTWNVGSYWMYCERIFLWPFRMPEGPLQSVMLQNGVGTVHGESYRNYPAYAKPLVFRLERNQLVLKADYSVDECHPWRSGRRKGSR